MTTLRDVRARAAELGATVEDEKVGNHHECRCEAPHRFKWAGDDLHELIDSTNRPWKPDYADMLSRMSYGLKPCDDVDCEWCNDL